MSTKKQKKTSEALSFSLSRSPPKQQANEKKRTLTLVTLTEEKACLERGRVKMGRGEELRKKAVAAAKTKASKKKKRKNC